MSKGLVLLHSLGIGRESGGVSSSPYWPLFSFLRPQDVFSKGLVHLPRKGRLLFPCKKNRISRFCVKTTMYVYADTKKKKKQDKRLFIIILQYSIVQLNAVCSPIKPQLNLLASVKLHSIKVKHLIRHILMISKNSSWTIWRTLMVLGYCWNI